MKSLVRWSATLGLVGTTLLGSFFGGSLRALALTEQQIIEKLRTVPVFMIARADGIPLHRCVEPDTGQSVSCDAQNSVVVTHLFINPEDAETFLERIQQSQPQGTQDLRVLSQSLGRIYQVVEEARRNQEKPLIIHFEPRQQQVNAAINLLEQSGQQVEEFYGVPLFYAVATVGEEQIYLPIRNGEQEIIPLYFDKTQIQRNIEQLVANNPEAEAAQIEIKVMILEQLITSMKNNNEPLLEMLFLEPSPEAIQFLRSRPRPSN